MVMNRFQLGIKSIFIRGNSGLTKMLNKPESLYVSKAVQKAFIEVNEEGAEAAAATGMSLSTSLLYRVLGIDNIKLYLKIMINRTCIYAVSPKG